MLAGEIGKPHGIAGEVYVVRVSDDPQRFEPGARLVHADGRALLIETARSHRDRLLVKFAGVDERAAAERLRGAIYVPANEVRDLDQDEYWAHDLVGATVFLPSGDEIGTIEQLVPGVAHDLLSVKTADGGTHLVPFVKDFLIEVDLRARRIVLDPPKGLLS